MPDSFGARVRKHREKQGIALETIAQQTKIKASLLDGLERGDLSQWPSGIFRRAYARAYAEAIRLNPDETAREFMALHPDPVEVLPPPPPPQPTRVRRLLDTAFGSFTRRRSAEEPEAPIAPAKVVPPQSTASPLPPFKQPQTEPTRLALVPAPEASTGRAPAAPPPAIAPPAARTPEPDLLAVAKLCTDIGRVKSSSELVPLLRDAARLLGARGLIVWTWDGGAGELRPAIIHGYSKEVRQRLRAVQPDADNATAEAFRLAETRAVASRDNGHSALAVPLLSAAGCAGVLAIELAQERAELPAVQAVATCMAAVLAQLIGGPDAAERATESGKSRPEAAEPEAERDAERTDRETDSGGRSAKRRRRRTDDGARTAS